MSTAPTSTVMLAVSLIALTLAFIGRIVSERRSLGLKRDVHSQPRHLTSGTGHTALRTGGSAAGTVNPTSDPRWEAVRTPPRQAAPAAVWSESDATRFSQAWSALQARFVDDPRGALAEADELVRTVLERRGYSMEESVDHPAVVTTYLAAQAITARHGRNEADTEALRKAVVYYRGLFDTVLRTAPARA